MGIPALNKETRIPTIDDFLEDIFYVNQDYVYDHEIFLRFWTVFDCIVT